MILNKGKVSIIVPVYNCSLYLKKCIESIINQTYKNIEFILIDDGSTDNSFEICKSYCFDDRIKIYSKQNGGPSSARNYGLKVSTGEIICFIDSDDYVAYNYIEKLIEKDVDYTIGGMVEVYEKKCKYKLMCNSLETYENEKIFKKFLDASENCYYNFITNRMYKRSIIIENNILFDEKLKMGEDLKFNIEYLSFCKSMCIIPECLYYYRKDNFNSLTKKFNNNMWYTEKNIFNEYRNLYKKVGMYESNRKIIDTMILTSAKKVIYSLIISNMNKNEKKRYLRIIANDNDLVSVIKYILPRNNLSKILKILIKYKLYNVIYMLFIIRTKI